MIDSNRYQLLSRKEQETWLIQMRYLFVDTLSLDITRCISNDVTFNILDNPHLHPPRLMHNRHAACLIGQGEREKWFDAPLDRHFDPISARLCEIDAYAQESTSGTVESAILLFANVSDSRRFIDGTLFFSAPARSLTDCDTRLCRRGSWVSNLQFLKQHGGRWKSGDSWA